MKTSLTFGGNLRSAGLLVLGVVTLAASTAGAFAQSRTLARATVPFAFSFSDHAFPAGLYTFGLSSEHIMTVQGARDTRIGMVLRDDGPAAGGQGKLIFRTVGDQRVLQEVRLPAWNTTLRCPAARSPKYREVAKGVSQPAQASVEVALVEGKH